MKNDAVPIVPDVDDIFQDSHLIIKLRDLRVFINHEGITLVYYVRFPGSAPVSNWFRQMPHMFIIIPLETRFTKLVVFECC